MKFKFQANLLLIFLLSVPFNACSILKKDGNIRESIATKKRSRTFQVHGTEKVINGNTTTLMELRFPKVRAANDASRMMFLEFGSWHEKYNGKYQSNIKQHIWVGVKLLEDERKFTVVTDGTENGIDYFASVIVFDSENKNCLEKLHPDRAEIIDYFVTQMNNLVPTDDSYQIFR